MDLKQLRALVTVVEAGSVTRAARLLRLVQPAVTRQIRALEEELGVVLFERTRTGMQPTDAGEALAERARRALAELDRARAELTPPAGEVTGIVTVGLLESTVDLLAEPLVAELTRDHPGVELRLQTGYSGHLQRWLDDGDLDLSLLYNLRSSPSLNVTPLLRERLWVAAPPGAALHADRPVPFAGLTARRLILPTDGHGLRTLINGGAHQAGVSLNSAISTNSMAMQKRLARAGHGWTILPSVGLAEEVAAGLLCAAPLCEPEVLWTVVLATSRTGRVPRAVATVARVLTRLIRMTVAQSRWPLVEVEPALSAR
ncbi:LysR family transcriptional regulator [Kibdelosporangium phytohabitans]|uniref:LysR family transcriptional regulator n=1 Tax=Kibdelosporangium phytohabitans TaxID=860235 RepID=A0A0N9I1S8_9PSEU|nr:LysR family transcriptional regulator [Kibdelosporangium phytohabitans]ALG09797.1 LysR family transcriptional regulator [Kibdelosporangium phytohabitans]MBE1468822.1 DNA-binding transcriptional LysR family regulator [Kibdelosporangium phytohabitans]